MAPRNHTYNLRKLTRENPVTLTGIDFHPNIYPPSKIYPSDTYIYPPAISVVSIITYAKIHIHVKVLTRNKINNFTSTIQHLTLVQHIFIVQA